MCSSDLVDFGAFVDLDGIDGLIHISELSWSHVNHPSEVLEIGQTVRVKVLDIDRDRQRISLGLKQTQADPWQRVTEAYEQGDVVHGRVTKVVTFGAFVEILPGVEGLVHISELAAHHVENPREVVAQGQETPVKIIEIDEERRRLSLSIKRVEPEDEVRPPIDMAGAPGTTPVAAPEGAETTAMRSADPEFGLSDEVFGDEVSAVEDDDTDATTDAPGPMLELAEDIASDEPEGAVAAVDEPEAEPHTAAEPQESESEPENVEPAPVEAEVETVEPEAVEAEAEVEAEAVEDAAVEDAAVEPEPEPEPEADSDEAEVAEAEPKAESDETEADESDAAPVAPAAADDDRA